MDVEADKVAIMAVLKAETDAWMRRDFDALAKHWVHSPQTRRMTSFAALGTDMVEGWDEIGANFKATLARHTAPYSMSERLSWDRVNIVVGADMAWVTYDQIGTNTGDLFELAGVQHELKIFQRIDGTWKIGCLVVMQRSVEHAKCPLIEVDSGGRVVWLNQQARNRIATHPGLMIAAGKLRARRHDHQAALADALDWAFSSRLDHLPPTRISRPSRAVALGTDDESTPVFCWVVLDDGKVLACFDNDEIVERKIKVAEAIFGLSPSQARLAKLIVEGKDLSQASGVLGISVNTARTQVQRMFDRTGVHNQAALVRVLLSAEMPPK